MESISLSQNEIKLLLGVINHAVKSGGLTLGDMSAILPLVNVLQSHLTIDPPADPVVSPTSKVSKVKKKEN